MRNIRFYLVGLFCFFSLIYGKSQLVAPYSDYSEIAEYGIDSLYFFAPDNDSAFIMADTSGAMPDSVKWEFFVAGDGFQPLADSDFKLFTTPTFIGQGYKLIAYRNGNTTVTRCWVISYDFYCKILTKDKFDTLLTSAYAGICNLYGPIHVIIESDSVKYYNPDTKKLINYTFTYNNPIWNKEFSVVEGKVVFIGYSGGERLYNIENAYWEDMWYWITVTDKLGASRTDSVFVRSITPHAAYTVEYIKLIDKKYYPDRDSNYYFFYEKIESDKARLAPANYLFVNQSKNADEYLWNFGDTTFATSTKLDTILHTYYKWRDNYVVTLKATHIVEWSGMKCVSTCRNIDTIINVSKPVLKAPNAFAVNSDEYPAWRFYDVSITDFEISIYNRYGVRVHHFKGNIRDWDGWDGRIGNSTNYASTGVYYYVVKDLYAVRNYNPDIKNGDLWGNSNSNGGDNNTDGDGNTDGSIQVLKSTQDNSGNQTPSPNNSGNSEYRGFFHLFNNQE